MGEGLGMGARAERMMPKTINPDFHKIYPMKIKYL
jgi:hypothetical protein